MPEASFTAATLGTSLASFTTVSGSTLAPQREGMLYMMTGSGEFSATALKWAYKPLWPGLL